MRVLFCIKALNNPGGGAERVMVEVANGLSRRGYDVIVLTFEQPGGQSFYRLDGAIERIDLGAGSTTGRATALSSLTRLIRLRAAVRALSPDVVVGFMHSMFVLLAFALVGTPSRVIASEHIVPDHYASRPVEGLLVSCSSFLVHAITCVSEQVKAQYPGFMRQKMVAIPNPTIAPSAVRADAVGEPGSRKVLLSVGRLVGQKDHETLVRAFAVISQQEPDWVLRIVGDGELRDNIRKLAENLSVGDRVELKGSVADISQEYLAAQLFVMSSRYESFGLATAEALAHGLPAIGFADCAGTNVLIEDGRNGVLVEPGQDRVGALAAALASLMTDPSKRGVLAAGATSPPQFGLDRVLDAWLVLLGAAAPDGMALAAKRKVQSS